MKTPIHQQSELELYSVCDVEPVELVMGGGVSLELVYRLV